MKTLFSILLAAVGIASAASGDTTRLDTLAYGRDTCAGAKTCRYTQVKIHSPFTASTGGGLSTGSTPVVSPNINRAGAWPRRGVIGVLGTSTIALSHGALANGVDVESNSSVWGMANYMMGSPYRMVYFGYAGMKNDTLRKKLIDTVMKVKLDALALHLGYNDIVANDTASARIAYQSSIEIVQLAQTMGIPLAIVTPHLQTDVAGKWGPTVAFDSYMQEWGWDNGVIVISGTYAITSNADKIGTAKTNAMNGSLHVSGDGAWAYAREIVRVLSYGGPSWRVNASSNVEWSGTYHNNPHMTGSSALSGSFSGVRPSNMTVAVGAGSPTGVGSKGSDDEGDYFDLAITSTTTNDQVYISDALITTLTAGKKHVVLADVEILAGNVAITSLKNSMGATTELPLPNPTTTKTESMSPGRLYLRSTKFDGASFPSYTGSTLYIYCQKVGTGTIRLRVRDVRRCEP